MASGKIDTPWGNLTFLCVSGYFGYFSCKLEMTSRGHFFALVMAML